MALDAATAALLGAIVGGSGTLLAAWLNPFSTAKHVREAKQLDVRREAYAAGIRALNMTTSSGNVVEMNRGLSAMMEPLALMEVVGSPDVTQHYLDVFRALSAAATVLSKDPTRIPKKELNSYDDARKAFLDSARADIGADVPYYDR